MKSTSKYQIWYDQIIETAVNRHIPSCYCERHHIKPRSFGGSDDSSNLALLTYREHFLVHWLLTKFTSGRDLRSMQRALFAMTMPLSGNRITSGWQFETAKRAIRDLELDPVADAIWRERFLASQSQKRANRRTDRLESLKMRPHERFINGELVDRVISTGGASSGKLELAATLLLQYSKRGRRRDRVIEGPKYPAMARGKSSNRKAEVARKLLSRDLII